MRVHTTRWTLAVIGGLAFAGMLLAFLVLLNSDCGFVGCTGTMPWGWLVPLVAGVVLGLVMVLLLDGKRVGDDDPGDQLRSSTCPSCQSQIIDEWRMCPHCGALLECDMQVTASGSPSSTQT